MSAIRSISTVLALAALFLAPLTPAQDHGSKAAITAEQAWMRAVAVSGMNSAAYMSLHNATENDDRLIDARAPGFAIIEIHETTEEAGVMRMRQLEDGLALPAGATVSLQPGGLHIMLIGAERSIAEGGSLPLTLVFEQSGELELMLPVKALTETGQTHHHH